MSTADILQNPDRPKLLTSRADYPTTHWGEYRQL